MTVCKLLYGLYGRDTRAAQWLNVIVAVVWLVTAVLHCNAWIVFALPEPVHTELISVGFFCGLTLLFAILGFVTDDKVHQVTKCFGLVIGALAQAVIANGYVSAYPPLDMMLVVSTALSLWFFGAVFYVMRCEGVNGTITRKT